MGLMGAENTGDESAYSQADTLKQVHLTTNDIFVVSPQNLAVVLDNIIAYIMFIIFHCIASILVLHHSGKGLALHEANESISSLLCAVFEQDKDNIRNETDYW